MTFFSEFSFHVLPNLGVSKNVQKNLFLEPLGLIVFLERQMLMKNVFFIILLKNVTKKKMTQGLGEKLRILKIKIKFGKIKFLSKKRQPEIAPNTNGGRFKVGF